MKNFWAQRLMINLEFCQCSGKELVLRHYKPYLTSLITPNGFMGKYVSSPFEKTSLRVRYGISLVMMQIPDFGHLTVRNIPLQSKKVTILQHKGKRSFNNYFTLNK